MVSDGKFSSIQFSLEIMTQEFVIQIGKDALWVALMVASPVLIAGLIIGLAVGIFQAVTQIHEMTLTFIPKILVVAVVLIVFLPWMLNTLLTFTIRILGSLSMVAY